MELVVPSSALLHKNARTFVYRYAADRQTVSLCEVKCLRPLSDGSTIVTSDGIEPGDLIVSAGIHALQEGDRVNPLAPTSQTNIGGLL